MSAPDRLPDEALDGLLDGSPSEEAAGTPLAAYLAELRDDAQATTPRPSEELSVLLAEGLDPAELEAGGILTASSGDADQGILTWRRRVRTVARVLVTKFAALGLLGKAVAAGAAVTVAASGAGAAGVLPSDAQDAFDDAIGREVAEAPAEVPADIADDPGDPDASDVAQDTSETPPETPADTADTPPLETDVSDDATGGSDGEPGVDGGEVAEDASDGRSKAEEKAQHREEPAQDESDADQGQQGERGEQEVQETPEDAPEELPTGQDGAASDDAPAPVEDADERTTANQTDAERQPDTDGSTLTDGDPRS